MSANTPGIEPVEIATGDRRGEVHLEPDAKHLVEASHLVRPNRPLPLQGDGPGAPAAADRDCPPIEDVRVAPEAPSVWDARPVDRSR